MKGHRVKGVSIIIAIFLKNLTTKIILSRKNFFFLWVHELNVELLLML